jgi:hypothetical protein
MKFYLILTGNQILDQEKLLIILYQSIFFTCLNYLMIPNVGINNSSVPIINI